MNKEKQLDVTSMLQSLQESVAKAASGGGRDEKRVWWNTYGYPETPNLDASKLIYFARTAMFFQVLQHGGKVCDSTRLYEIEEKYVEDIIKDMQSAGFRFIYDVKSSRREMFFVNETAAVYAAHMPRVDISIKQYPSTISCSIITTDEQLLDKIGLCVKKYIV
jgi:hypothetical protein